MSAHIKVIFRRSVNCYAVYHSELPEGDREFVNPDPARTFKRRLRRAIHQLHTRYQSFKELNLILEEEK